MTALPSAQPYPGLGAGAPRAHDGPPHGRHDGECADLPLQLGGVRISRLLGAGGMGRVYLGRHGILDIDVAVKVLHKRSGDRDRFLSEARLAARIQHPNIVRIHHAGIEHEYRFLVLEHVAGQNLKQVLKKRGRLPWREAAGHILQAAQGLAAAHSRAIIHRDVKPSNLLLDGAGHIKVADLGLARYMVDAEPGSLRGRIVGTPAYMAPEQAREASTVTPAADVYSLGVSLFVLIAGREPFHGDTSSDILLAHRDQPVPDLREVVADVPVEVAALVSRMLAKDPAHRPADGAAVAAQLEQLLERATATTAHTPPALPVVQAPRMRRTWLLGAAAAVAALVLVGWAGWRREPPAAMQAPPPAAAVPPLAAVQAPPADPWQTPARAVFALTEGLPAAVLADLDAACRASGLPVVERQRIDSLVREQDLLTGGRVDPATAGRVGRLVGGHIALFAGAIEDRVEVRAVLVETGEVVADRFVPPAEAGKAAEAALATALAQLPVQGRVAAEAGGLRLSAGTRQGLKVGDRLELRRADGVVLTAATVTAVERDRASIEVQPPRADCGGALAVRLPPP